MATCMRVEGRTRKGPKGHWQRVTCFVSFDDPRQHRQIVEDSFQYYLGLDLANIMRKHPDHFNALHNVGRAILLYYYFRENGRSFNDEHWDYLASNDVPSRPPDREVHGARLWIDIELSDEP